MVKLENMTRAERERFIYANVRQVTYDPALARKLRSWAPERILKEYGINVRRKRTLKPLPPPRVQQVRMSRARLQIAKYQYLREQGFSVARSKKLKRVSWESIRREEPEKGTAGTFFSRLSQWRKWASEARKSHLVGKPRKTFPKWIEDMAIDENRIANKLNPRLHVPDDSDVGWYIAFLSYTEGKPPSEYRTFIKPDPFDGERYKELVQTGTIQ